MSSILISYFIINFILVFKIVNNVYFVRRGVKAQNEMKEEASFYIPLTVLFGVILISLEYFYRITEGDLND